MNYALMPLRSPLRKLLSQPRARCTELAAFAFALLAALGTATAQPAAPKPPGAPAAATAIAADETKPPPARPVLADRLSGRAKEAYDTGKVLFRDNSDFQGALGQFREAYELSKDPGVKYNMAACEKSLLHYVRAAQLLREYLAESTGLLTDAEHAQAKQFMDAYELQTRSVKIVVNEPGATIEIDGAKVGESPLASTVLLDVGPRKLHVFKPDFKAYSAEVSIGMRDQILDIKLVRDIHEGKLLVTATPEDALITVDNRVVGQGSFTGTFSSGGHSVKVSAKDRKPFVMDVLIDDNKNRTLNVKLDRDSTPIGVYLGIAGAVVLAGTVTAGIIYLARPGTPDPVQGTFGRVSPGVGGFVQVNHAGGIRF
jgi:PEGA domain